MKSMTGYGRGDSSAKGMQLAVEISSVNRRQVEVAVSLTNELDSLEADLRKPFLRDNCKEIKVRLRALKQEALLSGECADGR